MIRAVLLDLMGTLLARDTGSNPAPETLAVWASRRAANHAHRLSVMPAVLEELHRLWPICRVQQVVPGTRGTRNHIRIVHAGADRFALRQYTCADDEAVERQHRLLRYAADREVPTPLPFPSPPALVRR